MKHDFVSLHAVKGKKWSESQTLMNTLDHIVSKKKERKGNDTGGMKSITIKRWL